MPPALFSDLYAEHTVLVASLAGTAHALTVMPRVCTQWRGALTADSETLWRSVTLSRFPILESVLSFESSTLSFAELYRRQIASEKLLRPKPSSLGIESYIFTITVELKGAVVLQWSGQLTESNDPRYWGTPSLWTKTMIPTFAEPTDENDSVVTVHVTHDMHTVPLLQSSAIALADTTRSYIQYDFDYVPSWPFADNTDNLYRPDINLCLWCNAGMFYIWLDDMSATPLGSGDFQAYLFHLFKPVMTK